MKLSPQQSAILHNETRSINSTDKYQIFNTVEIIDQFKLEGFEVASMSHSGSRVNDNYDKANHLVMMEHPNLKGAEGNYQVALLNSHNGLTSLRLNAGFIRFACSNQIILSDGFMPELKIKHTKLEWKNSIQEYVETYMSTISRVEALHEKMKTTRLSFYDLHNLAERAIATREKPDAIILDANEANLIRRPEDAGKDIWTSMNRVQESVLNGYYKKESQTVDTDDKIITTYRNAKKISNPLEIVRINKEVHEIYAELVY